MLYHWHFALSFLITVVFAVFAQAATHWDEMLVKHTWTVVPVNWESLGNTTAGSMINLHIALKSDQEGALIDTLYEVSNPEHPRYGAYLSKEQLAEIVRPHPDTRDLVRAWLVHHGIRPSSISISHGGSWLTVTDVLVSQANQLLGAVYQLYRNSKTNDTIIRTVGYALPKVLHSHIQTVAPTTYFPSTRRMRQTPRRGSLGVAPAQAPGEVVTARQLLQPGLTPSALRWLYKTDVYRPSEPYRSKIGVLGFSDEYPSQLDLTEFMTRYRSDGMDAEFTVERWNGGGYNPDNPSDLVNLAIHIGGDTVWDRYGRALAEDMDLVWINKLLVESSPPQTIIMGYGEPEQNLPPGYALSVCDLYAKLGLRGITVLVASGQDGVGDGNCVNADGIVQFMPEFPSSCPWVTSVGSTVNFRPEIAANMSGGGFSFYFQTPWYQRFEVMFYQERYPEFYLDLYNRNGRGYPDISAQALNYQYVIDGELFYMNGTICSVSTMAGIVSLYNDYRITHGQAPLGFFNPLLYSGKFEVKDVVFGANPGCGTSGFMADIGWDPATGLGTLELASLLSYKEEVDSD